MATGETGFSDVVFDLVSVQYHSLKAGHDYGQYVRDARDAGYEDVASFFEQTMKEDSDRAAGTVDQTVFSARHAGLRSGGMGTVSDDIRRCESTQA